MASNIPSATDIVFIDTLQVPANIGPDCWGKQRPQPIEVTVYLHLKNAFLHEAGESDDVLDSVHYGHLTKAISVLIRTNSEDGGHGFDGIDRLIREVAKEAFKVAGEAAEEVRVVVDAPKLILLAGNFSVDVTVDKRLTVLLKKVSISDLSLPVIIGVNPPERLAKQRVVTDIVFYEKNGALVIPHAQYQAIVEQLSEDIEKSAYLTLEKFVMQLVRSACLALESVEGVTVRAQKPSALSFAKYSGVEITRRRADFI